MPPSYNEIMAWSPGALGDAAGALSALESAIDSEAPKAGDPIRDIAPDSWRGKSRDSADTRAEGLTRWLRGVAAEFGELVTALENGERDIRGAQRALRNRTDLAASEGYVLQKASRGYAVDFDASLTGDDDAEPDAATAHQHRTALRELGITADQAVTDVHGAITAALGELGAMTPSKLAENSGSVDPRLAASDKAAVENGTATPEQLGRYLRAVTLTKDQLRQLASGDFSGIHPQRLLYMANALRVRKEDLPGLAVTGGIAALGHRADAVEDAHGRQVNGKREPYYRRHSASHRALGPEGVRNAFKAGKLAGKALGPLGYGFTFYDEWEQYNSGEKDGGEALASGTGALAGGALGGMAAGAAVGSFAGPVGTAIGVGIGAAIGSGVGSKLGGMVKGLFS